MGGLDAGPQATRETAQPSLWDRLADDLPGLASEVEGLRRALAAALGAARVEARVAGGERALEGDAALSAAQRERLLGLLRQGRRRTALELRGVVVTAEELRQAVRRDIQALFNTERFEGRPLLSQREEAAAPDDPPALADFPEARRSVVNFGVPAFAGRSARDFDPEALARELRAVLAAFEPRLKEGATRVRVSIGERTGLAIEIDGILLMTPVPERLRLRTLVDLETGWARTSLVGG